MVLRWFLYMLIRLLHATYRYRYFNVKNYDEALRLGSRPSFSIGLFHCNAVAGLLAHRGLPFSPLISQSRDGELIAFLSSKLGLEPIRGSSSKGAVAGQLQMGRLLDQGRRPAYTVDGPRGPRFKVKSGIIALTAQEQIAALPMAAIPEKYWEFKSWDRFRLAKPFSRIAVIYGPPLCIPAGQGALRELAGFRVDFQDRLIALESEVETHFAAWEKGLRHQNLS